MSMKIFKMAFIIIIGIFILILVLSNCYVIPAYVRGITIQVIDPDMGSGIPRVPVDYSFRPRGIDNFFLFPLWEGGRRPREYKKTFITDNNGVVEIPSKWVFLRAYYLFVGFEQILINLAFDEETRKYYNPLKHYYGEVITNSDHLPSETIDIAPVNIKYDKGKFKMLYSYDSNGKLVLEKDERKEIIWNENRFEASFKGKNEFLKVMLEKR